MVDVGTRGASFVFRHRTGNAVILVLMLVAATQLFFLQDHMPRACVRRRPANSRSPTSSQRLAAASSTATMTGSRSPSRRVP